MYWIQNNMIAVKSNEPARLRWKKQKELLKLNFPKLTDEDLNFDEYRKEEMLNQLEFKLGITSKELLTIIGSP